MQILQSAAKRNIFFQKCHRHDITHLKNILRIGYYATSFEMRLN